MSKSRHKPPKEEEKEKENKQTNKQTHVDNAPNLEGTL